MVQRDNILSFRTDDRRIVLDERSRLAVAECRRAAERTLPTLIGDLFEKLDDALYDLADKSDSNQLHSAYFDAMRVARVHRSRVENLFLQGVFGDYDRFWRQGPRNLEAEQPEQLDAELDLSLVDEDELEESLAVNNLVSKGENRYQRELNALNQRFAHLAGDVEVRNSSNPFGPVAICNRFRTSIRDLVVETPVRLVIYKLFDKHVMNYVGGLYEEINALLSRAGVMPKLAPRARRSYSPEPVERSGYGAAPARAREPGQGAVPRSGGLPGPAGGGVHAAEGDEVQSGLFHTLQGLLGVYRASRGDVGPLPQGGAMPVVETAELVGALSQLQQASFGHDRYREGVPVQGFDLRSRLIDQLQLHADGESGRTLGKTDDDTLDVIAMLFEFVLADPNLPDALKALIARLQIPMLKVAIVDKGFFSRKLHPARRLLNNLAQAAVGWSDDGDRSPNSLYRHIETIVNRVVTEFEDDPSLFETLDEEFTAYVERERRGAEIAEERTNQVTRGKEQLRLAKKVVEQEVARRLEQEQPLPEVVRELLEEGWKDVLLLSYLRQGPDSEAWKAQLELADRLVWSVQPKSQYAERQELLHAIPDLLRNLREGLNGISFDQHKTARFFKELQACHIACLRGGGAGERPGSRAAVAAAAPSPEDGGGADAAPAPVSAAGGALLQDRFTEAAESLAVGTWLVLKQADGKQSRLKLSWKSDVSDAYVFVNRKGAKALEMTLAGIAKLFRQGSAEVLKDVGVPIMDRALDAMVVALRSDDAGR